MSSISSLTSSSSSSGSSSSSSTQSIYNGHIFGLASGLDVDSIVSGLTTDVQGEIDKADQQKQTLQWKQTDYQAVATALNTFNSTYLALSGSSSITGTNALQTYTASSDNAAVTAVAQQGADGTARSITVYQNAAAASISSSTASQTVTGQASATPTSASSLSALENDGFTLTVDGVSETIKLTAAQASGITDTGSLVSALQSNINTAFGWSSDTSSPNSAKVVLSQDSTSGEVVFSAGAYTGGGSPVAYNTSFTVSGISSTDASGNLTSDTNGLYALLGTRSSQSNWLNRNLTVAQILSQNENVTLDGSGTYNVTVNGQTVALNGSDSIFTALSKLNSASTGVTLSYSSTTGVITASAANSGAAGNFSLGTGAAVSSAPSSGDDISTAFLEALGFSGGQASGQSTSALASQTDSSGNPLATAGQDAVFSIDGGATRMTRSSNSFTLDNVNYTINGSVSSSSPQKADISFTQDTGTAVKNIQNFVTAYNTLLSTITTYTNTKPDSDYQPLTDAQKAQMSDAQISDWNTKASAGVLFNDDTLNDLENELRDMVNQSVTTSDGTTISLADLGIRESTTDTGTDDTTPGQLVFDNGSTDTLVSMLQSHPQEVQDLFTMQSSTSYVINDTQTVTVGSVTENEQTYRKNTEGLAYRLQDIVSDFTQTGSTPSVQGKLISLLGDAGDGDQLNSIYDQITDVNSQITNLNQKMTDKKNALYAKFSTLESFMAQMNSQSGILSSLSGSSSSGG